MMPSSTMIHQDDDTTNKKLRLERRESPASGGNVGVALVALFPLVDANFMHFPASERGGRCSTGFIIR